MLKAARWAEQAVLQSPEIQHLRKDAERYKWVRNSDHAEIKVFSPLHGSLSSSLSGYSLDSTVDAAMEVKP